MGRRDKPSTLESKGRERGNLRGFFDGGKIRHCFVSNCMVFMYVLGVSYTHCHVMQLHSILVAQKFKSNITKLMKHDVGCCCCCFILCVCFVF